MPHPYKTLPARNFWKKAVAPVPWHQVFDAERGKFRIGPADLVSTAGSCFAQRSADERDVGGGVITEPAFDRARRGLAQVGHLAVEVDAVVQVEAALVRAQHMLA